ncbi:MAG: decaheme cytochrome c [Myxococcales bacterium]|nr:decaheme cytochrome c [Myxococcales bacterium]
MKLRLLCFAFAFTAFGCEGPRGVDGPIGPQGPQGSGGSGDGGTSVDAGAAAECPALPAGASPGLNATVNVSSPANGSFFVAKERAVVTIRWSNDCGKTLRASDLGTASLYVSGPRLGAQTRTASKLLNCVVDRAAADRQHHFVNLIAPAFADASQMNLATAADGTITFTLAPVSDEPAGTYTVGVWSKSKDDRDQLFPTLDLQIGNATHEQLATGPTASSTCFACHKGAQSGKSYQAHTFPGFSPVGNYALDASPIATCKLCHNRDGYSLNPTVRKVHGAHRGANQLAAGVAHPEYGLAADATLADYLDIGFPSLPGGERDCIKCHVDDRWKSASRLACGTCHDNVFFDTGTLTPPRAFGKPPAGACTNDAACGVFGDFATCDLPSGACLRKSHPPQPDDAQCSVCHPADAPGLAPISSVHEIVQTTHDPGLRLTSLSLGGGSGAGGSFVIGDTPTLSFKLLDKSAAPLATLKTDAALSATAIVSGPTDDRQRVYAQLNPKTQGTLVYDAPSSTYSWTLPSTLPALALAPLNTTAPFNRPNLPGTYTLWIYVNATVVAGGVSFRGAANGVVDFALGAGPIRPRQVIADAACNACHVVVQAHGGSRQNVGSQCSGCHTRGAVDRTVGAKGIACTASAQCPGNAAGWETCQDTNADSVADACVITVDPTPNQSIDFAVLVHDIHFARLRGGYAERNNLVSPGSLVVVGFQNSVNAFETELFPQDIRNCKSCHADAGGVCSTTKPCGIGQACIGATCVNQAWLTPSTRVCTSCHDEATVFGHAALNTWTDPSGAVVETCETCHGIGADFAVATVHQIAAPYVPPNLRAKQ